MPVSKIARNENRSNLQDRQAKEDRHTQDRQVQVAITLTKDRQAKVDSHIQDRSVQADIKRQDRQAHGNIQTWSGRSRGTDGLKTGRLLRDRPSNTDRHKTGKPMRAGRAGYPKRQNDRTSTG